MDKHLFVIDLDGTLLDNSITGYITKENKDAIKRLIDAGHEVMISTARAWQSTKKIYDDLEIDGFVSNYNGAYLHHPTGPAFKNKVSRLNLSDVLYVLRDKRLKEITDITCVVGLDWVRLDGENEALNNVFKFNKMASYKVVDTVDLFGGPFSPTSVVIDTKGDYDLASILRYLNVRYGDLLDFSGWSKGSAYSPVIDMVKKGINKGSSLSYGVRYYGIDVLNTVAIGDGYNDVPMFEKANYGIAMANGSVNVQKKADYVTDTVHGFINKFLDDEEFRKEIGKNG